MCCIVYGKAEKVRSYVKRVMAQNPDGTGIAWSDGNGAVRYVKGLTDPGQVRGILRGLEGADVVLHSRIATVGGKLMLLTHPFQVERYSPLSMEGSTDLLLFHNGHISHWEKFAPENLRKESQHVFWSDSRAVAHGLAVGTVKIEDLKKSTSRFLLFSPKRAVTFGDWKERDGLKFSNLDFERVFTHWRGHGDFEGYGGCYRGPTRAFDSYRSGTVARYPEKPEYDPEAWKKIAAYWKEKGKQDEEDAGVKDELTLPLDGTDRII